MSPTGPRQKNGSRVCLWLVLPFLLWPLQAAPAPGQEKTPAEASRPTLGTLEKSLLFPGWGQLAEKRYVEGIAFLSAEIFCLIEIFVDNHRGNENYALYQQAMTTDDAVRYRRLTEKYDTRRNQFLLAAAAVWAVNLVDIYLIVTNKEKKERAFTLKFERGKNKTISLAVAYRF
jgi:hypothetical protein